MLRGQRYDFHPMVDIWPKRLGLLRELLPRATRVAVLVDPNDNATVIKSTFG
jgi:hypothetical protein